MKHLVGIVCEIHTRYKFLFSGQNKASKIFLQRKELALHIFCFMHVSLLKFGTALIRGQPCTLFQKSEVEIQFLRVRCLLQFEVAEGILSHAIRDRSPLHPVSYLLSSYGCQISCCASNDIKCSLTCLSLLPNYRGVHLTLLQALTFAQLDCFKLHQPDLIDATNYHGSLGTFSHGSAYMDICKS